MEMSSHPGPRPRAPVAGLAGALGGGLVAAGALLPWFTLFAGLHPLRGTDGLYGRLLLAGGVLAVILGAVLLFRDDRRVRLLLGGLGVALLAFAGWIAIGVPETYRALQENPMLVARMGPGVWVALLGTAVVGSTLLLRGGGRVPSAGGAAR